jgi:maltose-binding protein MalE
MKNRRYTAIAIAMIPVLVCLSACGKSSESSEAKDGQVTLLVDLHSLNPSLSSTPTAEEPDVVLSTKQIIAAFEKENENIKIKIDRSKDVSADESGVSEWLVNKLNSNNCPAIVFTWGTRFQSRDYYLDLTDYLDTPNEYEAGNEHWKDMFYDYVWNDTNVVDAKGSIVAVPVLLCAGTETSYYYNKQLISSVPNNWESFISTAQTITESGKTGFAPWDNSSTITLSGSWAFSFSIGPSFIGGQMELFDYDGNNAISTYEQLRGVKEGKYNPVTNDYAKQPYYQLKRYYTTSGKAADRGPLSKNWQGTTYYNSWSQGNVAIREDGTWGMLKENNNVDRKFDYGVTAPMLLDKQTSQYALDTIERVSGNDIEYKVTYSLNIMKAAVEGKPEVLDAAVKFLKFLTSKDCLSAIAEETGSYIAANKQSTHSSLLDDYLAGEFPKVPNGTWPLGFTSEYNDAIDRAFQQWYLGKLTDADFFAKLNENQQAGADAMIAAMNIDTSSWNI